MRNSGGVRCVEGETTKMQHFQMIQFQLFISLNISSLYIFLTVRILIVFLLLLFFSTETFVEKTDKYTLGTWSHLFFYKPNA